MQMAPDQLEALHAVAGHQGGLQLLVLFGSRARGQARGDSDWDFAFIGETDPEVLRVALVSTLGTERIDLADLTRAGALLRYRAARDGIALFEAKPGAFLKFQQEAASFWCDIEPVVRRAYDEVLSALP